MAATMRAIDEYSNGCLMIGESGANTLISSPSDSSVSTSCSCSDS